MDFATKVLLPRERGPWLSSVIMALFKTFVLDSSSREFEDRPILVVSRLSSTVF